MKLLFIALTLVSVTLAYYRPCVPGTYFKYNCNTCKCLYGGRQVCTTKICQPRYYNPGSSLEYLHKYVEQIISGVSDIEIFPSKQIIETHSKSPQICTPYSFFYIKCNRCRCSILGDSYNCVKFPCVSKSHSSNVPGHQKKPLPSVPKYPVPKVPNQQHNPQDVSTSPNPNQIGQHKNPQVKPTVPGHANKPLPTVPKYPVPNVPNQQHNPGTSTSPSPNQIDQQQTLHALPTVPSHENKPLPSIPKYPIPNVPNEQDNGTSPSPNQIDKQPNSKQVTPTIPVPNITTQQQPIQNVSDNQPKHSHKCRLRRRSV